MENLLLNSHESNALYNQMASIITQESDFSLVSQLKARVFPDGNQWCVLYGDNIQEGVCGFGDTPYLAVVDFNNQWYKSKP